MVFVFCLQAHREEMGDYRCSFCDFSSHGSQEMIRHRASQHENCPHVLLLHVNGAVIEIELEEGSNDSDWLNQYVKWDDDQDGTDPNPRCSLCGMRRSCSGAVRAHVLAIHFRFFPYKCAYCPKVSLGVQKLKVHIETDHQGLPYKIVRRRKLNFDDAQQHRYKNQEIVHMLDPLPDLEMMYRAQAEQKEREEVPAKYLPTISDHTLETGTKTVKRRTAYGCMYCKFATRHYLKDLQCHVYFVHMGRRLAECKLCDFGVNKAPLDEKMKLHFEKAHPNEKVRWTDTLDVMLKTVKPAGYDEETEKTNVAAFNKEGEILTLEMPEVIAKKRKSSSLQRVSPNKRQKMNLGSSTESRSGSLNQSPNQSPLARKKQTSRKSTTKPHIPKSTLSNPIRFSHEEIYAVQIKGSSNYFYGDTSSNPNALITDWPPIIEEEGKFLCKYCTFEGENRKSTLRHITMRHTTHREFSCKLCCFKCRQVQKMETHISHSHNDASYKKSVERNYKPKQYYLNQITMDMMLGKQPLESLLRSSSRKSSPSRAEPPKNLNNGLPVQYIEGSFVAVKSLLTPRIRNPDNPIYNCNYCPFSRRALKAVEKHQKICHVVTEHFYSCNHCSFSTVAKAIVRSHQEKCHADASELKQLKMKNPTKLYLKGVTSETFISLAKANSKLQSPDEGSDVPDQLGAKLEVNQSQVKKIRQGLRGQRHSKRKSVKISAAMPSLPPPILVQAKPRIFKCNFCSRQFDGKLSKPRVVSHQITHTTWRRYQCSLCSYSTRHNNDIQTHYKSVHDNDKPVIKNAHVPKIYYLNAKTCNQLNLKYEAPVTSNRIRRKKGEQNNAVESGTPASSTETNDSKQQGTSSIPKPLIHSTEPLLYKCNYCPFTDKMGIVIQSHQRNHFTWRPYECAQCTFRSFKQSKMESHHQEQHQNKPPNPKHIPKPDVYYFTKKTIAGLAGQNGNNEVVVPACPNVDDSEGDNDPKFGLRSIPAPEEIANKFQCCICREHTGTHENVLNHQMLHFTFRKWMCKSCNFQTCTQNEILKHTKSHHHMVI